jgi:hypothetical protein
MKDLQKKGRQFVMKCDGCGYIGVAGLSESCPVCGCFLSFRRYSDKIRPLIPCIPDGTLAIWHEVEKEL